MRLKLRLCSRAQSRLRGAPTRTQLRPAHCSRCRLTVLCAFFWCQLEEFERALSASEAAHEIEALRSDVNKFMAAFPLL